MACNSDRSKSKSIYVSTACLSYDEPLVDRVSRYNDAGLQLIELGAGVYTDDDSLKRINDFDCNYLVHNYFPPLEGPFFINLSSPDFKIRKKSIDFVFNSLKLSAELNASFYSVHAGFVTDPVIYGKNSFMFPAPINKEQEYSAREYFKESIESVVVEAKRSGLKLLIENNVCTEEARGKLLLQTAEEIADFFNDLNSPYLGLLLDTGHLNVTARTFGFDQLHFTEKVKQFVCAFHIHDNDGITDTHQPIATNSWALNLLRDSGFNAGPIIVEAKFSTIKELSGHVKWLSSQIS